MKGTAYLLQATLVSLWWLGLVLDPVFYAAFQFPGINSTAFDALFLPDIVIVAILSIIRAYKPFRELEYIILGGFAFGTLYCINASILTQGGYLATTIMILGLCFNLFLVFQDQLFRESRSKNNTINGIKTSIQIICVWSITLLLFPSLILFYQGKLVEPTTEIALISGIIAFILFSILGLSSAFFMVRDGNGTPLPLDQTNKLVVSGPYRFVRNPMAIAGVGQVIAISVIYQSLPICLYGVLGGILWHFTVRPAEEKNMVDRFGDNYLEYKSEVRCWLPSFKYVPWDIQ